MRDVAVGLHLAQHIVAAADRPLRRPHRVIVGRRLGQHREIGRFGQRQLADILVEIGAARRLDAVGVPAKEDLVEVKLEDLLLAQRRFEAEGEDRLADLAADAVAAVLEQRFRNLLGDGRAALGAAAADALAGIIEDRADQARIVDPAVAEEGLVLGRDERLDDDRRIFVIGQLDAAFAGEGLDRVAVIAADVGRQRRLVGEQLLGCRQPGREEQPDDGEEQEGGAADPRRPPHPAVLEPRVDALMNPPVEADEIGQLQVGNGQAP